MKRTQAWDAQTLGRIVVNPERALNALGDANLTIFESVFPPNQFMHDCGFDRLRQCVDSGEIQVDPDIMEALSQINQGNLRRGADLMAAHEQVDVVQQVYDRHSGTFGELATAEAIMPGDQTSIPIANHCTRENIVSIRGLDIANPQDRVRYYERLMDRLVEVEGIE